MLQAAHSAMTPPALEVGAVRRNAVYAVARSDAGSAFSLDRLRTLIPALVIAFVAGHAYSRPDPRDSGGDFLDLYDEGCGGIVGKVPSLVAAITVALHGGDGQRLVEAGRADLAGKLSRISDMIAGK